MPDHWRALCPVRRNVTPGIRALCPVSVGVSHGHRSSGPAWSSAVQGGLACSRAVRLGQPRPAWSSTGCAAWEGAAHHPGAVRNRRARRFRVDWPSAGRRGLHAGWTQLERPPPGSANREYFLIIEVLTVRRPGRRPGTGQYTVLYLLPGRSTLKHHVPRLRVFPACFPVPRLGDTLSRSTDSSQ